MASPTIRGITAPAAGGSIASPAGTQVGDLVVVFTFERLGAGTASTLTLDSGNGYQPIDNQFHNDSSTDGAFGVGYKIATQSGAQTYQAFTSSTGTPNWATGCIVFSVGTFSTAIAKAFISQTTNAVPNPPSVTLGAGNDWLVAVIAAWHISAATVTPTAPTNYVNLNHIADSDDIELAIATRALTAAASEDPGTFGDDVTPSGSAIFTIGIPNPTATRGRVAFAELETPSVITRGRVSFAELEVPIAPTRGRVSFAELELPIAPTRGRVAFAELEVPVAPGAATRGWVSWSELEVPSPLTPTRGRVAWSELEVPLAPTRGRIAWGELEVPDEGGGYVLTGSDLTTALVLFQRQTGAYSQERMRQVLMDQYGYTGNADVTTLKARFLKNRQ